MSVDCNSNRDCIQRAAVQIDIKSPEHRLASGARAGVEQAVDYYQVLHVSPDAPLEIIKASYRALMQSLKQHPDLGGDSETAALINEAYATLSKPQARQAYDRVRAQRAPRSNPHAANAATTESGSRARLAGSNAYKAPLQAVMANRCPFCSVQHPASSLDVADPHCRRCQSPLTSKDQQLAVQANVRAMERLPREQDIELYTHWPSMPIYGRTLDVSLNGMLIQTRAQLELQHIVKISCALCEATARVAHIGGTEDIAKVGVEFVTLRFIKPRGSFVSTRA